MAYDVKNPLPTTAARDEVGNRQSQLGLRRQNRNRQKRRATAEPTARHISVAHATYSARRLTLLEVKLKAAVGMGLSGVQYDQTAIYGRGIGLVYMKTIMHLGKREETTEYVLSQIDSEKQG